MRHSFVPVALAASWLWFSPNYDVGSYCAWSGGLESYESCSFRSLDECRAYVSGVGGNCRPNFRAAEPYQPVRPKARKRHL